MLSTAETKPPQPEVKPPTTTFINITVALKTDEPLDRLYELLRADMATMWSEMQPEVIYCRYDRDQALAFVQAQTDSPSSKREVLTPTVYCLPKDVAAVLEQFNLTLPKGKKGEPEWRVPLKSVYGRSHGLASLYGRLVLTNGIHAFLVNENTSPARWVDIMFDNFIPDDALECAEALPNLPRRERKEEKSLKEAFLDFSVV